MRDCQYDDAANQQGKDETCVLHVICLIHATRIHIIAKMFQENAIGNRAAE